MDLNMKLTSLLKEKEEQERIEKKAHQRIIELNRLIKSAERLIKDANEVFGVEREWGKELVFNKEEIIEVPAGVTITVKQ